jgi:hypothetical protein
MAIFKDSLFVFIGAVIKVFVQAVNKNAIVAILIICEFLTIVLIH